MLGSVVPKASTRRLIVSIEAWIAERHAVGKAGIGDGERDAVVAGLGDVEVIAGEAPENVAADRQRTASSAR